MVAPLVVGALAGLGGMAGGMGLSQVLGGTKKESASSVITHAPYETYAPQQTYAPQLGYTYQGSTYIINSPGAESKKQSAIDQTSIPSQTGEWDVPQTTGSSAGIDSSTLILLGIIGAGAIIGYGLLSGGKK